MSPQEEIHTIQKYAKIAGILYLLVAILSIFVHFYVPSKLIVPGDAAATAGQIMASQGLFRLGIASEFVVLMIEIALSVLLYVLLKPVSKTLSLAAAVYRLAMTTVHGINLLNSILALLLLSGAAYLAAFQPAQLQAAALLFLSAYNYGFTLGILFFSLHVAILGYLIFKSGYFPKILGILFMIAALGYLIDNFSSILIANYKMGPAYLAIPIAIAEIAFPLWLLFKGVNAAGWERRE